MSKIGAVARMLVFVAVGIVTIAVGFFMLRGTMNMWNRSKKSGDEEKS